MASAAGRRCAVVDAPFMPLLPDFNGVQIREFAVHDAWEGPASHPPELIGELYARYGDPPLHDHMCDARVAHVDRNGVFEELLTRTRIKTEVPWNVIARKKWDLFFALYWASTQSIASRRKQP